MNEKFEQNKDAIIALESISAFKLLVFLPNYLIDIEIN